MDVAFLKRGACMQARWRELGAYKSKVNGSIYARCHSRSWNCIGGHGRS